jgi:RHS repeat-associated protein
VDPLGATVWRGFDCGGEALLVERDSDYVLRSYLSGLGLIWEKDEEGNPLYHYADAHGSTRMLCDSDGSPVAYEDYDAWGRTVAESEGGTGRLGYAGNWGYKSDTGADGDAETGGIIQCGVRFYDPDLGRFLQQDTLLGGLGSPATLNRYAYCRDDPVDLTDPLGLVSLGELLDYDTSDETPRQRFWHGAYVAAWTGLGGTGGGFVGAVVTAPGGGIGAIPGAVIGAVIGYAIGELIWRDYRLHCVMWSMRNRGGWPEPPAQGPLVGLA